MTSAAILNTPLPQQNKPLHTARTLKSEESFLAEQKESSCLTIDPQDKYLSMLQGTQPPLIDEELYPTDALNEKDLRPLDKKTLISIVRLLSEDITVKARDGRSFADFTFTFKELYAYLEERFEKDLGLKADELQIVGGMVFWLLKDTYLKKVLKDLKVVNPEEFLTESLMGEFSASPSDTDFRFLFPEATKRQLKRQKKFVEDFFIMKLAEVEKETAEEDRRKRVHGNAFLKLNTQYDEENCYSTVSVGDPEISRNFDLLFIKSLQRQGLFLKDMQLNISPLIAALKECQWDSEALIEAINSGKCCLKMFPESPFYKKAWLPLLVDCPALLIRALGWSEINLSGWPALVSAAAKGRHLQDGLNEALLKTFREGNADYLLTPKKPKKGQVKKPSYQEQVEAKLLRAFSVAAAKSKPPLNKYAAQKFQTRFIPEFRNLLRRYLLSDPADKERLRSELEIEVKKKVKAFTKDVFPKNPLTSSIRKKLKAEILKLFNEALKRQEDSLAKTPAFLLKKTLKNHHKNDTLAAFALTFNACLALESSEEAAILWETMLPTFMFIENPLFKEVHSLMAHKVPFHEVAALIQAKAFLHLNTAEEEEHFTAKLKMPDKKRPFIKVNLGGSFVCFPCLPENAFTILGETKNPHSLAFIANHLCPKAAYAAENPLPIPLDRLMMMGVSTLKANAHLGSALIVFCSAHMQSGRAFDILLDAIPSFLDSPHLMKSLSQLPLQGRALRVLDQYAALTELYPHATLKWAHALLLTRDEELVKRGYDLLIAQMPVAKEILLSMLKDLNKSRPDLALAVLRKLNPGTIPPLDSLNLWSEICFSFSEGKQLCEAKELLSLLSSFEKLLLNSEGLDSILASEGFPDRLSWLCKELLSHGQTEEAIRLLLLLKKYNVPLKSVLPTKEASSESSTLEENGKALMQELASPSKADAEERLALGFAVLADPGFCSNFSPNDIISMRVKLIGAAQATNRELFSREINRGLKNILEKLREAEASITPELSALLISILKARRQQSLSHFLNELLEDNLPHILQKLLKEGRKEEAVKLLKNASLTNPNNRMSWLVEWIPELSKPPTLAILQEAVLATASHILKNSPTEQEWHSILNSYGMLSTIPAENWQLILDQAFAHPGKSIRFKAFDLLINFLEKDNLLSDHPRERAACWLSCLQGFRKFPDEKVVFVFKEIGAFIHAFEDPLVQGEKGEAIDLLLESLKASFKGKKMSQEDYKIVREARESLKGFISEEQLRTADLVFSQCAISSGCPALLSEAMQTVDAQLNTGEVCTELEDSLIFIVEVLCKESTIDSELFDQTKALLITVRKRSSSLKCLPALLLRLGGHADSNLVSEACLILQQIKDESEQKDFKPEWDLKRFADAASQLLENATKNHFQETSPFLNNLFSDLKWAAFFKVHLFSNRFSLYMKRRLQNYTKDTASAELASYISCAQANLPLLRGAAVEDELIPDVIEAICLLGSSTKTFQENLILSLFTALSDKNSAAMSLPRTRKGKNSKRKQQPAPSESKEASKENSSDFEMRMNNWRICFLRRSLDLGFEGAEAKASFIQAADKVLQDLFRSKNKDERLFSQFLNKYLFLSFHSGELGLYSSYRKMTKETIEAALKEGLIDLKFSLITPCVLHFGVAVPAPGKFVASKTAAQPFEAMIEQLLAKGSLSAIREALFMVQEGRTQLLNESPESLTKIYKQILQKIRDVKPFNAECLELLEAMQKGIFFEHPDKNPSNPFIGRKKSSEWQQASKEISSTFIRTLVNLKTPDELLEAKLKIAQGFLSKALLQNCFEGNYAAYLRTVELLMKETMRAKDCDFFKPSAEKIYALLSVFNVHDKDSITKKERELRATSFFYWLKLLADSNDLDAISIGSEQLAKATQPPSTKAKQTQIFDGFPKILKSAENLFKDHEKKMAKTAPGKGSAGASAGTSGRSDEKQKAASQASLFAHNRNLMDRYLKDNEIDSAVGLLEAILNGAAPADPSTQEQTEKLYCSWIAKILRHSEGGARRACILWRKADSKSLWKIPLSTNHALLINELIKAFRHEAALFETFIDVSLKYAPWESCSHFRPLVLSHLEDLIARKAYDKAYEKIETWSQCFLSEQKIALLLKYIRHSQRDGFSDSTERLCTILDSYENLDKSELIQAVGETLEYLLEESFVYEDQLEHLQSAYSLLTHRFFLQFQKEEPIKASAYCRAFLAQAAPFEELKEKASSIGAESCAEECKDADSLVNELSSAVKAEVLDAPALKKILKDIHYTHDERVYPLVLEFLKKAVNTKDTWEGSPEDMCICLLYAIKGMHLYPEIGLFILENASAFLEYFEHESLLSFKLDALKSIFYSLENILKDAKASGSYLQELFALGIVVSFQLEGISSMFRSGEFKQAELKGKTLQTMLGVCTSIATLLVQRRSFDEYSRALKSLSFLTSCSAQNFQIRKIYSLFLEALRKCRDETERAEIIRILESVSKKINDNRLPYVDYLPFIAGFYECGNTALVKEACRLLKVEIQKEDEDSFNAIVGLLGKIIGSHLQECQQEIGGCLLQLNRTKWSGTQELAMLWEAFTKEDPEGRASMQECIPLLASLNGIYGSPEVSDRLIERSFSLLIIIFNCDLEAYKAIHQAFFLGIIQHCYFRTAAPYGGIDKASLMERNAFSFDFYAPPKETAERYTKASKDILSTIEATRLANTLFSKYFMRLQRVQRADNAFGKPYSSTESLYLLGLIRNYLGVLLNSSHPDTGLFIDLLTEFTLYPLTRIGYLESQNHLEKCEAMIKAARDKGFFNAHPQQFFKLKLVCLNLEYKRSIPRLNAAEEISVLFELLRRLTQDDNYSSLLLAIMLLQDKKPEILMNNPKLLLDCYRLVIRGLEHSTYNPECEEDKFLEMLANHALKHHLYPNTKIEVPIAAVSAPRMKGCQLDHNKVSKIQKSSVKKASTNQLLKSKKSREWKKASAKISKALFFALCRQEVAKDSYLTHPDFTTACKFLKRAQNKSQFDGHEKSYAKCLGHLLDYTFELLEFHDVDFNAYCTKLLPLFNGFSPNQKTSENEKATRSEILREWVKRVSTYEGTAGYNNLIKGINLAIQSDPALPLMYYHFTNLEGVDADGGGDYEPLSSEDPSEHNLTQLAQSFSPITLQDLGEMASTGYEPFSEAMLSQGAEDLALMPGDGGLDLSFVSSQFGFDIPLVRLDYNDSNDSTNATPTVTMSSAAKRRKKSKRTRGRKAN